MKFILCSNNNQNEMPSSEINSRKFIFYLLVPPSPPSLSLSDSSWRVSEHNFRTFPVLGYVYIVSPGIVNRENINVICGLFSKQIHFTQQKNRRNF